MKATKQTPQEEKSLLFPHEKIFVDLVNGIRKPQNQHEENLMRQINEMISKGIIIDTPNEIV